MEIKRIPVLLAMSSKVSQSEVLLVELREITRWILLPRSC